MMRKRRRLRIGSGGGHEQLRVADLVHRDLRRPHPLPGGVGVRVQHVRPRRAPAAAATTAAKEAAPPARPWGRRHCLRMGRGERGREGRGCGEDGAARRVEANL